MSDTKYSKSKSLAEIAKAKTSLKSFVSQVDVLVEKVQWKLKFG